MSLGLDYGPGLGHYEPAESGHREGVSYLRFVSPEREWDEARQLHEKALSARVNEFKDAMLTEDPEWCYARRVEFLKDEIARLTAVLPKKRLGAGKLMIRALVTADTDLDFRILTGMMQADIEGVERSIKKLTQELEHRPKPGDHHGPTPAEVDRARAYPLWKLLETKPGRKVLCPFHPDKVPSFHLFPDGKGHCFPCGHQADAIDWVMTTQGLGFAEAVRRLQ